MDSSVTPTSPSEMVILVAGLLIMLFGVYKVYRERGRPGLLILWGGLVDLGLALMGLGLGPSGDVGSIMIVIYHAIARLAAWIGLSGLVANPYSCVANDIRGALHRNPVGAVLLAFALEASLGISPAMTPEGQHLVLHAMAMHSVDVPLGGPVLAIIMAAGYTVLLWLSAEVVLQVCFTRPDEPICTEVPLGGGAFAHALFDRETELMGVPSGSWCPFVPNRWSRTPAAISLYVLLGLLVALGLGRFLVQDFGAWLIGIDPHTLVELEGPWHVTPLLLYVGSFLVLCPRIIRPRHRATYTFALFAAAFAVICVTDLPPLSRLFSLIISGIGALVACYSTNYIEEDGRKHWYWFFLLLTFGALLNIVTTDNIGTLSSQWEVMTWASFALVAWERTSKARDAAIKYVVLCCGAAYLMIVGFFMIGGDFTQYGEILANLSARPEDVLRFALVFTLLGFAAKAGLVPLHSWLPDAHPAAPSSVSAPLSGVLTKMGVFGVVMIYFGLLGYDGLAETGTYGGFTVPGLMVTVMGLCTMAYGEWMALRQEDIKRMLAYSTMGQVGEIFTVLGLGTWLAAAGALAHVLNHAIMKDLLFLCAGGLIFRVGSRKLSDLAGLVHEMPWAVGCMSIGIVSIMGLPPFNGFVSKYLMIVACMDAGQPLIAAALIAASLVGAIYYMRILRTILLDPAPAGRKRVEGVTATMRWPMIILAALCVILGVAPQTGLSLITPILDQLQFGPGVGGMLPALPELDVSWPVYVLLPMFGAIVPIWFRKDRVKAGWGAAAILFLTTLHVLAFGRDLDMLSYVMALFIPAIGTVNLVYAVGYMEHSHTQWRFYAFFLLMTGGLLGVAASSDLFSFFTFWEIMSSWALYFAIAHEGTPEALREGFKYFLFNVAGAGFLFLGIGLIVAYTGTGQFAGVASGFAGLSPAVGTAIVALLAIGFCMKAAQVSLRIDWQMHPALAPTPVSGYISSVLLKIAVFGLVKLFLGFGSVYAQGASDLFSQATIMYVVAWVGAFTLLYSAVQAMLQNSLKLVFIWSTVSQIGYMVLGVAVGTSLGMAGGLLHMANHVFFKDLLFLMVGAVMLRTHADAISELGGVGRRMPVTMFCFFIGSLAAVGVPPTNGFTSKWIIYQALMAEGEPLLALISLIGSVVTLAYLARFMHTVFLGQPGRDLEHIEEAPWVMRAPMLLMAFMVILTGVFPGLLLAPLNEALVEYGMPSLDVASYGLASGPGAWDATSMAVLMLVAFGGGWLLLRFLLARVKVRVAAPHACGHDASQEATRIPPEGIYPALVNLCTGNKPGSATCSLPELALTCCRNLRRSLGRTGRINKERPSC
ncbi:complex I subunit 5 family protein [uncultured Bilophila sp.]|uniref:complex I subunit 5 family protein n=1 Tax=uncultured Bilophila sp. TaxID=529385 RepID=UPI0025F410E2|nr:proton-conducting transporter membrane subunit [uncultured Bilophila sp.]